jgi:hypothetical protein
MASVGLASVGLASLAAKNLHVQEQRRCAKLELIVPSSSLKTNPNKP